MLPGAVVGVLVSALLNCTLFPLWLGTVSLVVAKGVVPQDGYVGITVL
jgi:hypothetical protein